MKVSELTGSELDRWVATAQGWEFCDTSVMWPDPYWMGGNGKVPLYRPSTDKAQAMALVIEFKLSVSYEKAHREWRVDDGSITFEGYGDTPMIAICRAVVASEYGEEVDGNE